MALWLEVNGKSIFLDNPINISEIKQKISACFSFNDFYVSHNGKIVSDGSIVEGCVHIVPRLHGGKGGFGSMLRAIGAQIEKTTNREACRDLSGRRLRDINEEKRLKSWIAQQAEREREAAERRKKKLERLCLEPKHDFSDQDYEKERSELTEKVYDAVEQGFRSASTSSACPKRKLETQVSGPPKKKSSCLWVDDIDENDLSSTDSSDSESEVPQLVAAVKCTDNHRDSPGTSHEVKEGDDSENTFNSQQIHVKTENFNSEGNSSCEILSSE